MKETKVTKRLVLSKETVKVLTDRELMKVAGGDIYTKTCPPYTSQCTEPCTFSGRPCCT